MKDEFENIAYVIFGFSILPLILPYFWIISIALFFIGVVFLLLSNASKKRKLISVSIPLILMLLTFIYLIIIY